MENEFYTGKSMLINCLLFSLYSLLLSWYLFDSNILLIIGELCGAVSLYVVIRNSTYIMRKRIIRIGLIIACLMLVNHFFIGNYGIKEIAFELFINIGIASLIATNVVHRRTALLFFYFVAAVFTLNVYGGDAQFMLRASRNYISVFMCISLLPYYSTFLNNYARPNIIPLIVCLCVCVLSFGRGGILMAALLLCCYFLISFSSKASKLQIIVSLIALFMSYYLFTYTDLFNDYFYRFELMGTTDEYRAEIWGEYINKVSSDIFYVLFGYPAYRSSLLSEYLNNLHNSYLMIHCFMGLFGIFFILGGVIKGLMILFRKRRWDLLSLICVFMIRAYTDWTFPLQIGGVIFYFAILIPVVNQNDNT